ncbi:hypothetical protein ACF1G0_23320 [Streptomyces sp. NPDC013953]|uniref:hypothetical protein n=1 Tax=Streptomyces sp. NPDC013953 TaxID=3364868 RepID=UPI0036FD2BF0
MTRPGAGLNGGPGTGAEDGPRQLPRGGLLLPVTVNLALGVPATIPLYCAWWLMSEYLPMDCRTTEDMARPGLTDCNHHTLDHAFPVMVLLAVTGLLMLLLILVVDVLRPLGRGDRLRTWLGTALLIPVPFAALMVLA